MTPRRFALAWVALASSCVLRPVDYDNLPCPCSSGWVCDQATNRCTVENAGPYTISASPTQLTLPQGGSAALEVTLASSTNQSIDVVLTQLPAGIASSPGVVTLSPGAPTAQLVLTASTNVPVGATSATVQATGPAGLVHTLPLAITIGGRSGSVDTSFGSGGTTSIAGNGTLFGKVAAQADGAVVVVADAGGACFVTRLDASGHLDASYGTAGRTSVNTSSCVPSRIRIDRLGRAVVFASTQSSQVVMRFSTTGALDTTFGSAGVATVVFGTNKSANGSGAILSDGRILVVGEATDGTTSQSNLAIGRLLDDGSFDPTFGTAGQTVTHLSAAADFASSLDVLDDGRIYVSGTQYGVPPIGELARFTANGALDTTFGAGGVVFYAAPSRFDALGGAHVGNGVLVGGDEWNGSFFSGMSAGAFALAYTEVGTLDTSFANAGKTTISTASTYGAILDFITLATGVTAVLGQGALSELSTSGSEVTGFGSVQPNAGATFLGADARADGRLVVVQWISTTSLEVTAYWQ